MGARQTSITLVRSGIIKELAADGRIVLTVVGAEPKPSRFERMRGIATVKLTTDEIMALTRGDD